MAALSAKTIYALGALYELTFARPQSYTAVKTLAATLSTSPAFLEQILNILKQQGIVESLRGAQGGYKLAKAPSEIFIADVIVAVQGELFEASIKPTSLVLQHFLHESKRHIESYLSISLAQLDANFHALHFEI